MADVLSHFAAIERAQVKAQADALHQLLQPRRLDRFAQLRLAAQDDAQHLFLVRLDAGHQADLLQHLVAEILRLVDDQHDLLVIGILLDQVHIEHVEQLDLALVERLEAEFGQHRLQELRRRELGLRHDGIHDVIIQLGEKRLQQRRLAGADLTRDDDETVGQPDGRLHVGFGARVLLAPVDELGIRRQPKRRHVEPEMLQIRHSATV